MGERLLCKQEVIGSIPFTSTRLPGVPPSKDAAMRSGEDMTCVRAIARLVL